MPELPEVETTRLSLQKFAGLTLSRIDINNPDLRWPVTDAVHRVTGEPLLGLSRRAKYLFMDFPSGQLMFHLGMSGSLTPATPRKAVRKHDHIILHFDQKQIRFHDPRRFGSLFYLEQPYQHSLLERLGPEPLEELFTADYLYATLRKRRAPVKNVIMDNQVVVGVGNIYASEALFHSGIHPQTPACQVSYGQIVQLVSHIRDVLARSIRLGGSTLRDYTYGEGENGYFQQRLWVYGRQGKLCRKCQTKLVSIRLGQRSSVFCPGCQPETGSLVVDSAIHADQPE